ncbi:MAG: aspartate ammonia-lyase [Bacteroidota bacterium]|nr:aspartate ammonia-lyase [Bacteroidota bacterium]MDP4194025.1 aspartate ammonia-lyase [Bacteroidota bacterium]
MRIEKDSLGELEIADDALYGIHSYRSYLNFPSSNEKVNPYLIKAYLLVKSAAAETNYKCGLLFKEKFDAIKEAIDLLLEETELAIIKESDSIYGKVIVDPYQGGAGTSLNMNINEIIANSALILMDKQPGDYGLIHPLDTVNMSQSTNDTYTTAFKIASIYLLRELTESFEKLQNAFQQKENEFKGILKLGRTEFQDAVPITLGQEFGAYAQAVSRDRWRLYNAEERLRSVNMGGTAIGNSVTATKNYVLNVNSILKKITGLPIAKGEDLIDVTQNLDVFAEVHGLVKAGATSIIKICNDLRFMSSGPKGGIGEIDVPAVQAGSSIMPGKINPVILEHAIQICELIKGNDVIVSNLISQGHLELNPFLPMISHIFLKSLELLKNTNHRLAEKCIIGITANKERCTQNLISSSALAASFIKEYGYETIEEIVKYAASNNLSFINALLESKLISETELYSIVSRELGVKIE